MSNQDSAEIMPEHYGAGRVRRQQQEQQEQRLIGVGRAGESEARKAEQEARKKAAEKNSIAGRLSDLRAAIKQQDKNRYAYLLKDLVRNGPTEELLDELLIVMDRLNISDFMLKEHQAALENRKKWEAVAATEQEHNERLAELQEQADSKREQIKKIEADIKQIGEQQTVAYQARQRARDASRKAADVYTKWPELWADEREDTEE